jgi:hypothetical protein
VAAPPPLFSGVPRSVRGRSILARSAWRRCWSGRAKPSGGRVDEHHHGGFEAVLAFAQFTAVRRAAQGADRSERGICQHLHLGVARDELYPEPGSFRAGARRSHSMRAARWSAPAASRW